MAVRLMMSVAPLMLGIILLLSKVDAQSKLFVDPDRQACELSEDNEKTTNANVNLPSTSYNFFPGSVHYQNFGKRYHFSWLSVGVDTKWTWVEARNYCRRFCMDAVSFDTRAEYEAIADIIEDGNTVYQ